LRGLLAALFLLLLDLAGLYLLFQGLETGLRRLSLFLDPLRIVPTQS
jgi:hypothetical protein